MKTLAQLMENYEKINKEYEIVSTTAKEIKQQLDAVMREILLELRGQGVFQSEESSYDFITNNILYKVGPERSKRVILKENLKDMLEPEILTQIARYCIKDLGIYLNEFQMRKVTEKEYAGLFSRRINRE